MRKIAYLILCIAVASCMKTDDVVDVCVFPPCDEDSIATFIEPCFAVPHHEDSLLCGSLYPIIGSDIVVFSDFLCAYPYRDIVSGYDKTTGEKKWTWENEAFNPSRLGTTGYYDGIFVFKDWGDTWGLDEATGHPLWHNNIRDSGGNSYPRMGVFGDRMYYNAGQEVNFSTNTCLVAASVITGEIVDTLFCLNPSNWDGFIVAYESYTLWQNENNEDILFVQARSYKEDTNESRFDILAYNVTMDSLWWEKKDVTHDSEHGSIRPFTIYEDKLFYQAAFSIYCFDINNGNELWYRDIWEIASQDGAGGSAMTVIDDLIVFAGKFFYVFKANTGFLLYTTENMYYSNDPDQILAYDKKIIYPNLAGIVCFDPYLREVVWARGKPVETFDYQPQYDYGLAIDIENKSVYSSDGRFGVCWEIPE